MNINTDLPASVRYVKNGPSGKWWPQARDQSEIHAGWDDYPDEMILSRDLDGLKTFHGANQTQDYNALTTLLRGPDYIWVTVQDGDLWWCTVSNIIGIDPNGSTETHGHFWLACDRPWSNKSIKGNLLAIGDLPGSVAQIAGFRATVCEPSSHATIRRLIIGEKDVEVEIAGRARLDFVSAVQTLVKRLHLKDFELLVDLALHRTGWTRVARLGGATEGTDVEVENVATGEIAFVQIKSRATRSILDDYISRFEARRDRYARMIFAVHTSEFTAAAMPLGVHIWDQQRLADLIVSLGLSDWLARRV